MIEDIEIGALVNGAQFTLCYRKMVDGEWSDWTQVTKILKDLELQKAEKIRD